MKASEFLITVMILLGLLFLTVLGFVFISYCLGYFSIPLSEWSLERFFNVFLLLFLLITVILTILWILLLSVQKAVKQRGPQVRNFPDY